jgi:hypothetical protein
MVLFPINSQALHEVVASDFTAGIAVTTMFWRSLSKFPGLSLAGVLRAVLHAATT